MTYFVSIVISTSLLSVVLGHHPPYYGSPYYSPYQGYNPGYQPYGEPAAAATAAEASANAVAEAEATADASMLAGYGSVVADDAPMIADDGVHAEAAAEARAHAMADGAAFEDSDVVGHPFHPGFDDPRVSAHAAAYGSMLSGGHAYSTAVRTTHRNGRTYLSKTLTATPGGRFRRETVIETYPATASQLREEIRYSICLEAGKVAEALQGMSCSDEDAPTLAGKIGSGGSAVWKGILIRALRDVKEKFQLHPPVGVSLAHFSNWGSAAVQSSYSSSPYFSYDGFVGLSELDRVKDALFALYEKVSAYPRMPAGDEDWKNATYADLITILPGIAAVHEVTTTHQAVGAHGVINKTYTGHYPSRFSFSRRFIGGAFV